MTALLGWAAVVLAALGAVFLSTLTLRRMQVARAERNERSEEERLRPIALLVADGEDVDVPDLGRAPALVLARLLSRYARWLSGDARERIAAYFERTGGVAAEREALGDRRPWRRATAAYALGDMASPTATEALLAALDDPERDVRAAAARSLGRLGAPDAVAPLVHALATGRLPRAVTSAALLAIGVDALPALRELERNAEAEVRAVAVELVGLLGDAADAPLLAERLEDSSAETRAKAARALGRIGAADATAALRRTLDDRIPFVRASAAHALGQIGDELAVPALIELATHDLHDGAHAAARAAARIDAAAVARASGDSPHLAEAADLARLA